MLALIGTLDLFARDAYRTEVEADTSARLDSLARTMSDTIARETAAADTMAVFVELLGFGRPGLEQAFPVFADALLRDGNTIRSVQLAPEGILDFVYPLEGNEAAVGLDLFANEERRRLLLPAIESGNSVMQGPFELVQGGQALAVRHPIYRPDGSFWGFAAVILDWDAVTAATGFDTVPDTFVTGIRLSDEDRVIAGNPDAFTGDPLLRSISIGATDTRWTMAMRPADGWPSMAQNSTLIWAAGGIVALLAGILTYGAVRRPQLLEEQRLRAVADLERSEATFQATFESAVVGIVIGDVNGRVLRANPAFGTIVGRDHRSLDGVDLVQFVAPEHRHLYDEEMKRVYRDEAVAELDVRVAGTLPPRWGRVRVSAIPGEERLFVGIVEDITDRLLAEAALAASEGRFRRLFEHAPIAIQREDHTAAYEEVTALKARGIDIRRWYTEDDRRLRSLLSRVTITDLNPAARQLQELRLGTGFGPGPLVRHYTDQARDGFIQTLEAIADGRTSLDYKVETTTIDGDPVFLDLKWQVPEVDGEPDYGHVMLTLHDSTDLHIAQLRLEDEIASKDRFLASVAHELRTPLTAVVGFAQELQEESGLYSAEERKEFQNLIAYHSGELAHLIEDLLVWARADIGEVQVRPTAIDLSTCVAECLEALPDVDLPLRWDAGEAKAYADPSRVRQIVRNLATNAVRYGGPNPSVRVWEDGDWSMVDVSDDGPELDADQYEAIFAPYVRSTGSPSQPGSIGLGLTVSRTLARLQDGDVVFVREGDRNIFRLNLPKTAGVANADVQED
ncbi:MAG: PAS domain S-box protein [Acidimicrobiia bacterium]|nr:PAS domain S-box protein [Acidimicrobiia bacterium]